MATLAQLAALCDGQVIGDDQLPITAIAALDKADKHCIAPFHDSRYAKQLTNSQAGAIVTPSVPDNYQGNALVAANAQLAFAKIAQFFHPFQASSGVHPTACVAGDVDVPSSVYIGPHAVVETGCTLAEWVQIQSGAQIGAGTNIGEYARIDSNVIIYTGTQIGAHTHISAGAVIGADGFGYVRDEVVKQSSGWLKMPQIGQVIVGDNVQIGANTTVDRGSMSDTVIADDVIIDNLVQIAHNVSIGRGTAIAACSAIAGSTHVGSNCLIAGRVSIDGHLQICDGVTVYADSLVTKSIAQPGIFASSIPAQPLKRWHRTLANLRKNNGRNG